MSYNRPFTKENGLFDTDMSLFSSPPPNEKTSLLRPSLATLLYHQEDSPSKNSSDGNLHAESTEEMAGTTNTATAAGDSVSTTDNDTMVATTTANESIQEEEQDDDELENPYENLLKQATLWTMEMRSLRDEIFMLQIRTAIKLDHLTMLGVDEMMDFEY